MQVVRTAWRAAAALVALVALWCVGSAPAAPPAHTLRAGGNARLALSADEHDLWLTQAGARTSAVYRRGVSERFGAAGDLRAAIVAQAAARGLLYVFQDDGAFLSLRAEGWVPERNLPRRLTPVDLVGAGSELYALIASPEPGELPLAPTDGAAPESQPFDPGRAPLSVVRYDSRGWVGVAACPGMVSPAAAPRLQPRLGVVQGAVCLFWCGGDGSTLHYARLSPGSRRWQPGDGTSFAGLAGFWVTTVSRVPLLMVAIRGGTGGESIGAHRLQGELAGEGAEWRPVQLQLSGLPSGLRAEVYTQACGFNQHAALLALGSDGRTYLCFARPDAAPTEATLETGQIIAGGGRPAFGPGLLQALTLAVLLGVLLALFLFRRGALVRTAELPDGCAPALTIQRLAGAVIDIGLVALIAAAVAHVSVQASLRALFDWAFRGNPGAPDALPLRTILWWEAVVGIHAAVNLVLELATGRTIGKLFTATAVLSESGGRPSVMQIVVRNLLRMVELQPPLWVLGFLVLLSRNRQRLGDLLARTLVVRRARPATPPPDA